MIVYLSGKGVLTSHSHESPGENWTETDSLICVKWPHAAGSAGFLCQAPDHDSVGFLLRSRPTNHRRSRWLKWDCVTFQNHDISCDSGTYVMVSFIAPLDYAFETHGTLNTFHWRCKRLNVLAHRKEQTPGVYLCLFKSDLCHCCFSWCWEMKCIRVPGNGHFFFICNLLNRLSASLETKHHLPPNQYNIWKALPRFFGLRNIKLRTVSELVTFPVLLHRCLIAVCPSWHEVMAACRDSVEHQTPNSYQLAEFWTADTSGVLVGLDSPNWITVAWLTISPVTSLFVDPTIFLESKAAKAPVSTHWNLSGVTHKHSRYRTDRLIMSFWSRA